MKLRDVIFKMACIGAQSLCTSQEGSFCRVILRTFSWDPCGPQNWRTEKGLLSFLTRTNLLIWNNVENTQPIHSRNYSLHPNFPSPGGFLPPGSVYTGKLFRPEKHLLFQPQSQRKNIASVFPVLSTFCISNPNPLQVFVLSGFPTSNKPWRKKQLVNTNTGN